MDGYKGGFMAIEKKIEIAPDTGIEAEYFRLIYPFDLCVHLEAYKDEATRKKGGKPAATLSRRIGLTEDEKAKVMNVLYAAVKRLDDFLGAKDIDPDTEDVNAAK
jgi:hypothetical protein